MWSIAASVVSSRLDYCNSLLVKTTEHNLKRLQSVQNSLARVVSQAPWSVPSLDLLRGLHWLPIRQRIHYKTALITYKTLHTGLPIYIAELLHDYQPIRELRSSSSHLLQKPPYRTVFASRAFSYTAPDIWNKLKLETITAPSVDSFKIRLKTELFDAAFSEQA